MKRITAIFLSLMLAASVFSNAFTAVAASTVDWEDLVALSDDAELDEEASSIENGRVTFKVTLPVDGYAQFQQPLRSLISYDTVNLNEQVTIVVGGNTKAEYNYSMLQVQLVGSADASTDIVPVDEVNGEDPGTQAMTWHLYGPRDDSDPIVSTAYGLNKGSSTASGAQFTMLSNIENHHLMMLFTEETNGTVTVSQRYGQNSSGYAYRRCASTYTLDDLNAEDGVYFRIRNNDPDEAITYTVTINSADVTTAYRSGDYTLSGGSTLDSSSVVYGDNTVYTFTSTLEANGGYVQLNEKLTDMADDGTIGVKVIVGDGTSSDYAAANVDVQLTADSEAKTDLVPVNERTTSAPTDAMSWLFYGTSSNMWFHTGSSTAGGTTLASPANTVSSGLRLNFTKDEDGYVTGTYVGIQGKARTSQRMLSEIGGEDGVYLRIRNNASTAVTYTVTVTVAGKPYTDGKYKFSNRASSLVSSTTAYSTVNVVETATVTLAANGGYVQLDKKLTDMVDNGTIGVKLVVGDGMSSDYAAANVDVQLTADSEAKTDLLPVNESTTSAPTDAMSWLFYGNSSYVWFHTGSSTAGSTNLATPANTVSSGLRLNFTKDENGYVTGTYVGIQGKARTSQRTLTEISGEDGVYLRIRNNASTAVTYTVTVTVASHPYTDGHYKLSDEGSSLISSSTSFDGEGIVETATFSLTANGGYAQLDRKLGDMIQNGKVFVKVVVGDGTSSDYAAANVDVQLTADSEAQTDLVPVNENTTSAPTDAMSWLFYGTSSNMWFHTGSSTAGGTTLASPANTVSSGLRLNFTKDEDGYVTGTYVGMQGKARTSQHTLSEIGGEDGVYLRLRNNASTAVTYTVTVKTSIIDFDRDGISGASDLVVLRRALLFENTSEIPEADLNLDNVIDIRDLIRFKKHLG